MKDYYIVVPAYNEEDCIGVFLKNLLKHTNKVILVDDGSTDRTRKIASKHPIHIVSHDINLGKGAALKTGCEYAFKRLKALAVIFLDSDNQHDPKEIAQFVNKLKEGHHLVFGIRRLDASMPLIRIAGNKFISFLVRLLFGTHIPDIFSGYKAVSKWGYKKIKWNAQGYDVETEIAARTAGKKIDFATVNISTIYNNMDRGMTFMDALGIIPRIVVWRLSL